MCQFLNQVLEGGKDPSHCARCCTHRGRSRWFGTLPHSGVWLSGRKSLVGAPSPCRAPPDFPALNGVLHYTRCSRSSPVQGLSCIKADTAQPDTPLWSLLVNFASWTVCQKLPLCNSILALFRHVKAALLTFSGPLEAELAVLQTRSLDKL